MIKGGVGLGEGGLICLLLYDGVAFVVDSLVGQFGFRLVHLGGEYTAF